MTAFHRIFFFPICFINWKTKTFPFRNRFRFFFSLIHIFYEVNHNWFSMHLQVLFFLQNVASKKWHRLEDNGYSLLDAFRVYNAHFIWSFFVSWEYWKVLVSFIFRTGETLYYPLVLMISGILRLCFNALKKPHKKLLQRWIRSSENQSFERNWLIECYQSANRSGKANDFTILKRILLLNIDIFLNVWIPFMKQFRLTGAKLWLYILTYQLHLFYLNHKYIENTSYQPKIIRNVNFFRYSLIIQQKSIESNYVFTVFGM